MTARNFRIVFQSLGLLLLTIGTAAVDWRASVILLGTLFLAFGVHATIRAYR